MVQHNYIHRLALGRSAFEAPILRQSEPAPQVQSNGIADDPENATYVQQYDDRGHAVNAESRSAARRLRRAQNDVLSTIGITLPTTGHSGSISAEAAAAAQRQYELEDREGWSSLGLSLVFETLISSSTTAMHNQRVRLQTFARYAGVPVSHAIAMEARQQGLVSYFLAGEPEFWASHMVDVIARVLIMTVPAGIENVWIKFFGEDTLIEQRSFLSHWLESFLSTGTAIFLCPFAAIVSLQRLQLIPATPLFIWPWQYTLRLAYLSLLPPLPATWTASTAIRFLGELPLSPLGLSLLTEVVITKLRGFLTRYSRAGLPRPDNPEKKAITAANESTEEKWPIHDYPLLQSSFKEEFASDLRRIGKFAGFYWYRLKSLFVPAPVKAHRQQMLDILRRAEEEPNIRQQTLQIFQDVEEMGRDISQDAVDRVERQLQNFEQTLATMNARIPEGAGGDEYRSQLREATELVRSVEEQLRNVINDSGTQPGPARHNSLQEEHPATANIEEETQEDAAEDNQAGGPLNSHPPADGSAHSVLNSSPSSSPPLEPTNVQVRTRSGSTSTLHMDVEINQAAVNGSTYTTSFSASPRSAAVETAISHVIADDERSHLPHHRVTELSLLPADLLSQCILRVAVQALIIPIQSYQCRNIARRFLATAAPDRLDEVYFPTSWFGLGLSGGRLNAVDYVAKLGLCLGAEAVLGLGSWLVVSRMSSGIGRTWFLWGQ